MTRIVLILIALCGFGRAQHAPKAPTPKPPLIDLAAPVVPQSTSSSTTVETVFPLPLELRDKFRDLQHENDSIEIENQKMLVKIEQNRARQALLVDRETAIASEFGRSKQLDLAQYELDPAPIALRKKKAK
jgi:hypothetical protein